MRVAVVLTGQPRYLEQSAWWWKNKVFPSSFQNLQVDYFCYFWNDNYPDLKNQCEQLFNPVRFHSSNYSSVVENFISKVKERQQLYNDNWHLVPDYLKDVCFYGTEVSNHAYNLPGMYISSANSSKMTGILYEYDVVIKTRSDTVFNPMSEKHWLDIFSNMERNPVFHNNIFSPWLRIKEGAPFFSDLAFIGRPELMYKFLNKMDDYLLDILTKDRYLFGELLVNDYHNVQHWLWNKLSLYNKTDWLAFSVVWPVPFNVALIRKEFDIQNETFSNILSTYEAYEAEKHKR
jgi:hypothetical protein